MYCFQKRWECTNGRCYWFDISYLWSFWNVEGKETAGTLLLVGVQELNGDAETYVLDSEEAQTPVQPTTGQNPLLILFTSGTTGLAKVKPEIYMNLQLSKFRPPKSVIVLLS